MYRIHHNGQLSIEEFHVPFGGTLDSDKAPQLEPQTLLLHLEQLRPGEEWYRRKRTLQRRVEQ